MTDRHAAEREAVIARLRARLGDQCADEDIVRAVHAAFDELIAHAKIDTYLPVLAERSASARLADVFAPVRLAGRWVRGEDHGQDRGRGDPDA